MTPNQPTGSIRDIWLHAHNMIRSARKIINENLRPLNLSSAEGNILLHLLTQGEDRMQEQIGEELDISKPAVSRALDSLEAKGFITRQHDDHDRRARRVRLTGQARAIGPDVEQAYNQLYARAMVGISPDELAFFVQLFGRMAENFSHIVAETVEDRDAAS